MPQAHRKSAASGTSYSATVPRPGAPAPQGRAVLDTVSPRDVSYQPTAAENKLLTALTQLRIDPLSRAEAECIIRRSLANGRVTNLSDRKTIQDQAKKFGITTSFG